MLGFNLGLRIRVRNFLTFRVSVGVFLVWIVLDRLVLLAVLRFKAVSSHLLIDDCVELVLVLLLVLLHEVAY